MSWLSLARRFGAVIAALAFSLALSACGGGGGGGHDPKGTLTGTVSDATVTPATAVVGAKVTVFDASTNAAVNTLTTGADGKYSITLAPGSYYTKVAKQGYESVPPRALEPVPFAIADGQTTVNNISMFPGGNTNTGWISGKVAQGSSGVAGVLVVASLGNDGYSALTDANGNYAIYNVPVGDYSVTAHRAGYSATAVSPVTVAQGVASANVAVSVTAGAAGQVPVSFNLIAATGVTSPAQMLVALIHPLTKETIPGLVQVKSFSSSLSYTFTNVPDGSYLVRATYANDTIVVDPDSIRKFGEPSVSVNSGTPTPNPVDIKATSAVGLVSPTNAMTTSKPALVNASTAPTFSWNAYPSTSDYVVEVMDATTGAVIWGGFSGAGNTVKQKSTTATSIAYDGPALQSGHVYRWRVYASKDDNTVLGWHLISASEDQQGLIEIQ